MPGCVGYCFNISIGFENSKNSYAEYSINKSLLIFNCTSALRPGYVTCISLPTFPHVGVSREKINSQKNQSQSKTQITTTRFVRLNKSAHASVES